MSEERVRFRTPWLDADSPSLRAWGRRGPGAAPRPDDRAPASGPTVPGGGIGPAAFTPPHTSARPTWVNLAFFAVGVLGVIGFVAGPVGGNSNITGALITTPVLIWLTMKIARRFARADGDEMIVSIIMGGLCLKIIAAALRYRIATDVYGTGDFFDYNKWGVRIADGFHGGDYISAPGRFAGTNFIRLLTGIIYTISPGQLMSGFIVYAWISFIGLLFFWRAYRVAVSATTDLTYLKWIILLPSLMYWPSAIGKDSYMVLAMGITSFGAACLLTNQLARGMPALTIGFVGMCVVRPHIALIACGGLILANIVRGNEGGARRFISIVFIAIAGLIIVQVASSFLGIDTFNRESVSAQISETTLITADGGSTFSAVQVNSPLDFPLAAFTVLYRPMPWEAQSPQVVLTSIEGVLLVLLTMRKWRSIRAALARRREYPYFIYALGALIIFIVAFSGFSNFGLLARQRAVIQPLLLVFIALPRDPDVLFRGPRPGANTSDTATPAPAPGAIPELVR